MESMAASLGLDVDAVLARYGVAEADVVRLVGITYSAMANWRRGARQPDPHLAITFEQKLNIPRYELRPDLWPPPEGYRKPKHVTRQLHTRRVLRPNHVDVTAMLARYGLDEQTIMDCLGLSSAALVAWRRGARLKAELALRAEQELKIPRYELRPDLWPPPKGYKKPPPVARQTKHQGARTRHRTPKPTQE